GGEGAPGDPSSSCDGLTRPSAGGQLGAAGVRAARMDLHAIRREIPCLAQCIYTNTAGFGPMPRPVWEDLRRREEAIYERGLDVLAQDPEWWAESEAWRQTLAGQFGAETDEIALGRALGEGLNMVVAGLDWKPGDEIII